MKKTNTKTNSAQVSRAEPVFAKTRRQGFFSGSVQRKLAVGKAGDKYEKEADSVADKVVQGLATTEGTSTTLPTIHAKPISSSITSIVQNKCTECEKEDKLKDKELENETLQTFQLKPIFESNAEPDEEDAPVQRKCAHCEEEEEKLHRKEDPAKNESATSSMESTLNESKAGGSALPSEMNRNMSHEFGHDFSDVRIHTDSSAAQMSKELNAQAFTHGSDIYFSAGKYDTTSTAGRHLLAHELAHTVQQGEAGIGIQRECDENATTKPTLEEVTKNCPSEKGTITDNPKTVTISKLKVKQNAPESIINSLEKPITLPPPGSRKDSPTKQVGLWGSDVREPVTASMEKLLGNLNTDQTVENKKDPKNKYTLKLKTGKGETTLTGTFTELVNGALVSKWNTDGKTMAFQVEHILDYQVAGKKADDVANLMLLSASVNNTLGSVMREYIRSDIQAILAHYNKYIAKGTLVTKSDEARDQYAIKAADFEKINPDVPKDQEIVKKSLTDAATDPLRFGIVEMGTQKLKKGEFILKSNKKGGGIILPYNKKKFNLGSYELTTDGDAEAETIKTITAKQIIDGSHTEEPPETKTYNLIEVSGEVKTYKANEFGAQMANLKLKYLSPIEFSEPKLDEGLNMEVTGTIKTPGPSFLSKTPIEIKLVGRELSIEKTFSSKDLGDVGPIKVDETSLTLSLGSESGLGAAGMVAFSIPNAGKGTINAKGNKEGFTLAGTFDFESKTFNPATVKVTYDSVKDKEGGDPWTFSGKVGIPKGKVTGINKASITVGYGEGQLTLNGNADLDVPGVKSAGIDAAYKGGNFNLTLDAKFDFKSKYIQNPNIKVTLGSDDAGWKLGISGGADIVIPNWKTIGLMVSYNEGLFDASATVNDLKVGKYVTGTITLGATNASVDEKGNRADKGNGKQLLLYGSGSITVKLGESITSELGIKLNKDGKVLITGRLEVTKQRLLKKDLLEFKRNLFTIATPNVPLFTIGVGDIFFRIEGTGDAMAKIGSPVISISVGLKEADIFNPQEFNVESKIVPEIEAEAGLDLGVAFFLGARALILEFAGNIGGTLKLHIKAGAIAVLDLTWSPEKGIRFKHAEGSLNAGINVTGEINGGVTVDLNLFLTRIRVWEKKWPLAEMNFGDLGQMSFKFPIDFDENGSVITPDVNTLKPQSPYAEKGATEKLLSDKAGGEKKVEKKPEDFKKEIVGYLNTLPAIGPANPLYSQNRGRHYFVHEIEASYKEESWAWLREAWVSLERIEFQRLADDLRQPRSDKIEKSTRLKLFAIDHTTVPQSDIDTLAKELELYDLNSGQSTIQTKRISGSEKDEIQIQNKVNGMIQKDDQIPDEPPPPEPLPQPTWDPEQVVNDFLLEYDIQKEAENEDDPWAPIESEAESPAAWIGNGAEGLRKNLIIHGESLKLGNNAGYKLEVINKFKDLDDPAGEYLKALKAKIDSVAGSEAASFSMLQAEYFTDITTINFIDNMAIQSLDGGTAFPTYSWAIVKELISPPPGVVSGAEENYRLAKRYYDNYWPLLALDMFRNGLPVSYGPSLGLYYFVLIRGRALSRYMKDLPTKDWMRENFLAKGEHELNTEVMNHCIAAFAYFGEANVNWNVMNKWKEASAYPWLSYNAKAISDFRKEYEHGLVYLDRFFKFEHKGVSYSLAEIFAAAIFGLYGLSGQDPYMVLGLSSRLAREKTLDIVKESVETSQAKFTKNLTLADEMVQALTPNDRLYKAVDMSLSKGFAGESIRILFENLDDLVIEILKEWAKEKAKEKGIRSALSWLGGPWARLGTLVYNAIESIEEAQEWYEIGLLVEKLVKIVTEARESKTIIQTQRSAARLAAASVDVIQKLIEKLGERLLAKLDKGIPKDDPKKQSAAKTDKLIHDSADENDVNKLSKEEKDAEIISATRSKVYKSDTAEYEVIVELPNGHLWKRNKDGIWCRSTNHCLVPFSNSEFIDDLNSKVDKSVEDAPVYHSDDPNRPTVTPRAKASTEIGITQGRSYAVDTLGLTPLDLPNPLTKADFSDTGYDDIMMDKDGNYVILEYKGGLTGEMDPGTATRPPQMSDAWVRDVIRRMRAKGPEWDFITNDIEARLNNGTLRGYALHTPVNDAGIVMDTVVIPGYENIVFQ